MRSFRVPLLAAFISTAITATGVKAQTADVIREVQDKLALQRMNGAWIPEIIVTTEGAKKYPLPGKILFFDGNEFARIEGDRSIASGTFKFEDGFLKLTVKDKSPWDLEAPAIQEKSKYAYKVDGDLLTLCFSVGDKGKAGDLTPGEGRMVVIYKRQKPDGKAKPEAAPTKSSK